MEFYILDIEMGLVFLGSLLGDFKGKGEGSRCIDQKEYRYPKAPGLFPSKRRRCWESSCRKRIAITFTGKRQAMK